MSTSSPSAQIGRYGTISLMKRQDSSIPLTSFGIDAPELTFGRDPSCGVRLYYAEIAIVHCRIVFDEDRKAFMCVLGESGVMVDGCFVKGGGEMVPLVNESEFEIRGKKFRFMYPPKEMRAALYASPVPTRTPRLSLITSTQVFSPRPSPDPRENLRILKSPLKNTFKNLNPRGTTPLRTLFANASSKYTYNSPVKPSAPAPLSTDEEEEEEDDNIVLVDGNHPRVVEDEKDLVILEEIDHPVHSSHLHVLQPRTAQQEPPRTPVRRRSQSLHRAVLIRSAQRAVLKAERDEREKEEEEMEEMEVLDAVAGLHGEDGDGDGHGEEREHEREYQEEDDNMDIDMDVDMEEPLAGGSDDEQENKQQPKQKLTWRKSFERLWPFRSSSPTKDEETTSDDDDEDEDANANDNDNENPAPAPAPTSSSPTNEEDENEEPAPLFAPPRTPLRPQLQHHNRTLGPFMTPQPRIGTSVSDPTIQRTHEEGQTKVGGAGRFSLGGGEARRVVAESQVWRVRDIVVPPPSPAVGGGGGVRGALASPVRPGASESPRKTVVGEEERKAIQERRRSALREPSGLGFVPGFSPMKTKSTSLVFPGGAGPGSSARPASPTKASTQPTLPAFPTREKEEEEEDTRRLLERMRETVEGMKRRRSEVPPPQPPEVPVTPARAPFTPSRGRSPAKKGVFSLLRTEPREVVVEMDVDKEEVPSPGEEEKEDAELSAQAPVQDVSPMDEEPTREKPRSMSKAKFPAPVAVENEAETAATEPTHEKPRSKSKAKSPAPVRVQEEVESVSTKHASEKPRSKSRARSLAPVVRSETEDIPIDDDHSKANEPEQEPEINNVPEPEAEIVQTEKLRSKPRSRSKSMLRAPAPSKRTTRVSPAPAPQESDEEPKVRSRKATVTPAVEEATPQPEEAPVKRGRKATTASTSTTTPATITTPVPPTSTSSSIQDESAPTRRARKLTVEPEDKEAPKRGRKLGVTTAATNAAQEGGVLKRGARKTPASAPAPVVDNEKEPVKRGRTPRSGSAVPTSKLTSKNAAKMEITGEDEEKEKKFTVKGRKRAGTIKKEDDAGSVSGDSVNPPTTSTANTTTTKARTPAVGVRTRKTPASAPAVPMQEVNKENENGEEESVKVRVPRKGRGKKDVVTHEDDEVEVDAGVKEEVVKGKVGRATRTRTRTRT